MSTQWPGKVNKFYNIYNEPPPEYLYLIQWEAESVRNSDIRLASQSAVCFLVRRKDMPLIRDFIIHTRSENVMRLQVCFLPSTGTVPLRFYFHQTPIRNKEKDPP